MAPMYDYEMEDGTTGAIYAWDVYSAENELYEQYDEIPLRLTEVV